MPRAGLDPASVTEAAAALADEIGISQLSMSVVAERLGVKAPSLYKHVDGLADLSHRIAVLAATELGDELRDAMQGRAGRDALAAAAQTVRDYVKQHPGRYAATFVARPADAEGTLTLALDRTLASFAAVLRGYGLEPSDEIHALRMLRSVLHGFGTLEASDGFQMAADVEASFAWVVEFLDRGLRASSL
ncbi:TetR/AcrR family transcriptional regulator [Mycetocola zhadangensis]|uniref:TetR/AcrR family transcriptional regulator n=1 Tax=Mycetocola zhadangensis TaxID=1164595 RepID=A0A3L7J171_9MICO|nr:TetR-like C-terminal domain-containing protein [Mycetocola zhadangensis]RLQ84184.1 TetR/AcrR family transcriptional regulator [Mycetocola zhadangensis]GGE95365.1 TetR family transcriptional regulator [Mycetocola zhadangensis]